MEFKIMSGGGDGKGKGKGERGGMVRGAGTRKRRRKY
jgi:hypothetical protein